jgi:hypothetical protein
MFDDFKNIFEFPIAEKDQKKVAQLIQFIGQKSLQGGGKVPLLHILNIAGFDQKKGKRIQKLRGDLVLKSKKGKLEGMFLNTGKKIREKIPNVPLFTPEIIGEKKIEGNFKVSKNQLDLTKIQGLTVIKTVGDDLFDIKFKVQKVVLTPKTVAVI